MCYFQLLIHLSVGTIPSTNSSSQGVCQMFMLAMESGLQSHQFMFWDVLRVQNQVRGDKSSLIGTAYRDVMQFF